MATNQEDEIAAFSFGSGYHRAKSGRIDQFARGIAQDLARCGVARPGVEAFGADLAHLGDGVARSPGNEISCQGVGVGVLGPANEIEVDFHSRRQRVDRIPPGPQDGILPRLGRGDFHGFGAAP